MSTNTELIAELRDTASKGVSVWGDLQKEAADAIEALESEIQRQYACIRSHAEITHKAEALNRKFIAEVNGPTFMGEPVNAMLLDAMQINDRAIEIFRALHGQASPDIEDSLRLTVAQVLKESAQQPIACMVKGKLLSYKDSLIPEDCFLYLGPQPKEPK